jgi:hypothetical protein
VRPIPGGDRVHQAGAADDEGQQNAREDAALAKAHIEHVDDRHGAVPLHIQGYRPDRARG